MTASFRRHFVGKTLSNGCYCDVAEIRFIGDRMDIFVNQLIQFYANNSTDLRPLTSHNMPSYTHKMAIVS